MYCSYECLKLAVWKLHALNSTAIKENRNSFQSRSSWNAGICKYNLSSVLRHIWIHADCQGFFVSHSCWGGEEGETGGMVIQVGFQKALKLLFSLPIWMTVWLWDNYRWITTQTDSKQDQGISAIGRYLEMKVSHCAWWFWK